MQLFFLSIAIIACGGISSLFFQRRFTLMKVASIMSISAGCFMGLIDAVTKLLAGVSVNTGYAYLNDLSIAFHIDPLSAFFLVAIFAVSLLAAIYSYHYMETSNQAPRIAVNYLFFSLLIASMALVVTANNMVTFLLCWEIMSLSSFFLVIFNYESDKNLKAGYLYFIYSHVGAMFLFSAFGVIFAYSGSFGFSGVHSLPGTAKITVFMLAFIGFGSKAGVFPFHAWLPHAHPAAPSHISAVMSGVMIKTGIYGIIRIYDLLQWPTPLFGNIVLIAGIASGILGVVYALGQHEIKRLLAYHSVENIGIILIGIGIGMLGVAGDNQLMAVLGFSGGLLHVLNHAIFKSLLFMGAGMVLHKTGAQSIDVLGGLIKRMKITGTTFLIGSLAIAGLPPFNGFISEFLIFSAGFNGIGLNGTNFVLSLLAIISLAVIGGLALACFTKVVGIVFQGEPRSDAAAQAEEKGITMLIPMMVLAGACVVIGFFPGVFTLLAIKGITSIGLGFHPVPVAPFTEMALNITRTATLFLIIILVLLVLRLLFYRGKSVQRSCTWGCGFTQPTVKMQYTGSSYAADILAFFRPVAPLREDHSAIQGLFPQKTHYHSHVGDIVELNQDRLLVRPLLFLFDKLRWLQHGDIHLYIGYILFAIVVLLFFV